VALMPAAPVRLTTSGSVTTVQLDKPPVNAFDLELVDALSGVVIELAASDARAVVFRGNDATLAAGGDVKWMQARSAARDRGALRAFFRAIQRLFDDIERLPMPTVAVVRGATLGGGFELALACDLRVASDDARLGSPEATLGLLPGAGGTQRLREIVGRGAALELLYTGRSISAAEGHRLGLVNRVAAPEAVDAAVDELVREIVGSTGAALAAIKACVLAGIDDHRRSGFRHESSLLEELALHPETGERLAAFVARRERRPRAERLALAGAPDRQAGG